MGVLFYKIWHDLWGNKSRTLQVVLIIAMGAFAIGMIVGTRNLVIAGEEFCQISSIPAMVRFLVPMIMPMAKAPMAMIKTTCSVRPLLPHKSRQIL